MKFFIALFALLIMSCTLEIVVTWEMPFNVCYEDTDCGEDFPYCFVIGEFGVCVEYPMCMPYLVCEDG